MGRVLHNQPKILLLVVLYTGALGSELSMASSFLCKSSPALGRFASFGLAPHALHALHCCLKNPTTAIPANTLPKPTGAASNKPTKLTSSARCPATAPRDWVSATSTTPCQSDQALGGTRHCSRAKCAGNYGGGGGGAAIVHEENAGAVAAKHNAAATTVRCNNQGAAWRRARPNGGPSSTAQRRGRMRRGSRGRSHRRRQQP